MYPIIRGDKIKQSHIYRVKSTLVSHGDDFWKENPDLFEDILHVLNKVGLDLELKDEFKP